MLGAYGFFYGIYRDRIEAGTDAGSPKASVPSVEEQIDLVTRARAAAALLGIVPFVVWLIFLGPAIEELEAAFEVDFAFSHYSAVDVAFFAVANAWLVIAAIMFGRVVGLQIDLGKLRSKLKALAASPAPSTSGG